MMIKYVEHEVTFAEIPDEISLCINISNCPCHCKGCHSPHLAKNIGTELTFKELDKLIKENDGVSVVAFMGGDSDPFTINYLAAFVKQMYNIKTAWYSGREKISEGIQLKNFDFIKVGPYRQEYGPLNNPNTNQRMYEIKNINDKFDIQDITYKFYNN